MNVVGIANGRKILFNRDGIELDDFYNNLMTNGVKSSPEIIRDEIFEMNIFNSVFVDCTSSQEVSNLYKELMSNNISIVTANKIAASSAYENYRELKETARKISETLGCKFNPE